MGQQISMFLISCDFSHFHQKKRYALQLVCHKEAYAEMRWTKWTAFRTWPQDRRTGMWAFCRKSQNHRNGEAFSRAFGHIRKYCRSVGKAHRIFRRFRGNRKFGRRQENRKFTCRKALNALNSCGWKNWVEDTRKCRKSTSFSRQAPLTAC